MDVSQVFSGPILGLCAGIGTATALVRRPFELKWPVLKSHDAWTKIALPTFSVVAGGAASAFSKAVDGTVVDKVLIGVVCGFFSSYVFRAAKAFFSARNAGEGTQ